MTLVFFQFPVMPCRSEMIPHRLDLGFKMCENAETNVKWFYLISQYNY